MTAKSESLNMVFLVGGPVVGGPVDKMPDGISFLASMLEGWAQATAPAGPRCAPLFFTIQVL